MNNFKKKSSILTILHKQDWPYEADANLLRLIMKVIDLANHDSCAILASSIFASNSRIWLYRFLYSNAVQIILSLYSFLFVAYSRCFTTIQSIINNEKYSSCSTSLSSYFS